MSLALECAIVAAASIACGFLGHRLHRAVSGTMRKRFVVTYFLHGVPLAPATALAVIFAQKQITAQNVLGFAALFGALSLPYVGTRLALHVRSSVRSVRREEALPFEHWFELLRTNPDGANAFLKGYLAQRGALDHELLAEISSACASLESRHASDHLLPGALDRLRAEAVRLEHARATTPGAGLPRSRAV
jgi:hypothetical protein